MRMQDRTVCDVLVTIQDSAVCDVLVTIQDSTVCDATDELFPCLQMLCELVLTSVSDDDDDIDVALCTMDILVAMSYYLPPGEELTISIPERSRYLCFLSL